MLTKVVIDRMAARDRSYMVCDSQDLFLRVYPSRKKKWIFRRRVNGKDVQATLGEWPSMGILEARRARDERLRDVQAGGSGRLLTLGDVIRDWTRARRAGRVSESTMYYTALRLGYLAGLHGRAVRSISRPELVAALRAVSEAHSPETARRTAMVVKMVFDYAADVGELDEPHCALGLARALPSCEPGNFVSIHDPAEIGVLLRALDRVPGFYARNALQTVAYCFVRSGELRAARWSEIDWAGAVWNIPAAHTKMKRDHAVPLSRQMIKLLKDVALRGDSSPDALVFPSSRSGGMMGRATAMFALRALQKLPEQARPKEMTVHGFRSMASTLLNEHGWNRDAIERQLAHWEESSVRRAYNKAEYMPIRRAMMQWYADYLDSLRDGAPEPEIPK